MAYRRALGVLMVVFLASGGLGLLTALPAVAAVSFTATADLDGRDLPSEDANILAADEYRSGQLVPIICQARGEVAYGSAIWDKTTSGHWVTDAYIRTGSTGFAAGMPRCDDDSLDISLFSATADLDGRSAPSLTAATIAENVYRSGQLVPVLCQATGAAAYGSNVWDRTEDDVWVSDAYVKTGSTGFAPGVARCTSTAAPTQFRFKAVTDLNGRASKTVSASAIKSYASGSTLTITCQSIGENAYGSTIWDRTSDGLWVTDHYLKTGFDTFVPGIPRCSDTTTGSGRTFLTTAELDGRSIKSVSAPAAKVYLNGARITVTCQAYGEYAYGSYLWDRTSDGLWVADFYVKTGATGFISNMPRCDNDKPSGGTPSGTGGSPTTGGSKCDTAGHGRINGAPGSTSGTASEKIARVLAAAKSQTGRGLSYAWGAGGRGGPACGSGALSPSGHQDRNLFGFDCSGFTEYAFWAGAGIDIGTNSSSQSVRSTRVSVSSLRAGDLIFWGEPGNTGHVAIYAGNGQMYEAAIPRSISSVHQRSVYGDHTFAVRIIS